MTATELHQTDPEFQALIQCWIADKRCPIPMADFLRERGLEGQAEAAEWAAWGKEAEEYEGPLCTGPFPTHRYWFHSETIYADWAPKELLPDIGHSSKFVNHTKALLWLLDQWAEVAAQGVDLPKAKVGVGCV